MSGGDDGWRAGGNFRLTSESLFPGENTDRCFVKVHFCAIDRLESRNVSAEMFPYKLKTWVRYCVCRYKDMVHLNATACSNSKTAKFIRC